MIAVPRPAGAPAPVERPAQGLGNRVWFAQALRGIAALLVVLEHLTQDFITIPKTVALFAFIEPSGAPATPPLHQLPDFFIQFHLAAGMFSVGLFFLVSGFVIPFSLERRTLGGFAIRRFFRLYPTLWCCIAITILTVVLFAAAPGFPYSGSTIGTNGLLFSGYASRYFIDPVYWTLVIEEVFYVAVALLAWRGLLHRRSATVGLAGVLAVIALWLGNPRVPSVADPSVPLAFMVRHQLGFNSSFVIFILIGVVFHHHYRALWKAPGCLALGTGLLALYWVCLRFGPFPDRTTSLVYFWSSLAALVVFLPLYVWRDRVPYSKTLDALGAISYPLYLIHTIVGWVLIQALTKATGSFYLALPVVLVVVTLLAIGIHVLVEKPSMEMGRRVAGLPRFRRDPVSPAG